MTDAEIRSRIDAARRLQSDPRNRPIGAELIAEIQRALDDLDARQNALRARLKGPAPDFARFAPSPAIAEAARQQWMMDVDVAASTIQAATRQLRASLERERAL